jgi:hypothetical protein
MAEVQFGLSWPAGDLRGQGSSPKNVFGSFSLDYGALEAGPTEAPYDAFSMAVRVGGGATVSAASIRGRLASRRLGSLDPLAHQLVVAQEYGYREAPGFMFGEQSVIGGLASRVELRPGVSLTTSAFGGAMVLGSIDSQRSPSRSHVRLRSRHDRLPSAELSAAASRCSARRRRPGGCTR